MLTSIVVVLGSPELVGNDLVYPVEVTDGATEVEGAASALFIGLPVRLGGLGGGGDLALVDHLVIERLHVRRVALYHFYDLFL